MVNHRSILLQIWLLLLVVPLSHSFVLKPSARLLPKQRTLSSSLSKSNVVAKTLLANDSTATTRRITRLFTTEDDQEKENTVPETTSETSSSSVSRENDDDAVDGKRGLTKTLLLAVPLFCKFVIVLMIKFVTDLIVFPLLFLYRAARMMKRKLISAIRRNKNDDIINGAS